MIKKVIAFAIIGIAGLDLLFGNTQPVLPDWLGNRLTQQWDLILIGLGVVLLFLL